MPAPIIDRLSPSAGWPGSATVDGTLVIVHGRYFHPTPDMHSNLVRFAAASGGTVSAAVEWASVDEIDYQPDGVVANDSTVPGGLDAPRGVAFNSDSGVLYIADTEHDRIVYQSASGTFASWGRNGSGNGEFNRPTGLAVDDSGNVYVADSQNHRIQKFSATGAFLAAWGSHGSGIGQFDMPVDVDVAQIGGQTMVYIADSNNHRVARSDANGGMPTQLLTPADSGSVLGVCAPRGYGFVYATDPAKKRIYRWAWHGPFNGYFGDPGPHNLAVVEVGFPMGIEQDYDGYVYVTDNSNRVVRKFDPFDANFREIARFGLTIPSVPGPTPIDEFVDPVDIAVTDLKAAYIVDRNRKQVVRYTPTDAQELWVRVPQGAVTGNLQVETDDGLDYTGFIVYERGQVDIADAYLTQGLVEYPLVAGKKTMIRYQMRTLNATSLGNYCWGSPVHDSAVCHIFKDGSDIGQIQGQVEFRTMTGGFMTTEIAFEILFEVPPWLINEQANYRFRVSLQRTGTPAFSDTRDFPAAGSTTFANRESYRIIASPITHLQHDGSRVHSGDLYPALFYLGADVGHMLDWIDWSQLYSGYVHYNRLYPLRYSVANIVDWGVWPNNTMHNGIDNDDEVRDILEVLEMTRRNINEDSAQDYDYMLGIVDRNEVVGSQEWAGVTSDSWHSALVSAGDNLSGVPAYDVGSVIAHELLHQHNVHHQSVRELVQTAKDGWNSVSGEFVEDPVTLTYESPTGFRTFDWNDDTTFAEGRHNSAPGSYDRLYDALANPHPREVHVRERAVTGDSRPANCPQNFNLIGHVRDGRLMRAASWIGRAGSAVTPEVEDGEGSLLFLDDAGNELLRWRLRASFGLRTTTPAGHAGRVIASDSAPVSVTCPFPEATTRVVFSLNGQEVWRVDIPSGAPLVTLLSPTGGSIGPRDNVMVEWEASHPQNAELNYRVDYSCDGGKTFKPLAVGLTATRYEWQTGLGARGGRVRLRVVASDGFHESNSVSDDFAVEDVARRVAVVQPRRGEVIPEGKTIHLLALASDIEQGNLTLDHNNTRWWLDDEVILGDGNDFGISELELTTPTGTLKTPLPVGAHRLKVEVSLTGGNKLSDEIAIEIAADSDRDGVPDQVEIERGTDPNDPGDRSTLSPLYPFGQWRFRRQHVRTLLQISHLMAGELIIDLGFVDSSGAPLKAHPVTLFRSGGRMPLMTDNEGWIQIPLGSLNTVLVVLSADQNRSGDYGFCKVRVSKSSPLRQSTILAHGWMSRHQGCWLWRRDSQGTIVINEGQPLSIKGAKSWRASSLRMAKPRLTYRVLGRLTMASQRFNPAERQDSNNETGE